MEHVKLWWWLGGEIAFKLHPAGSTSPGCHKSLLPGTWSLIINDVDGNNITIIFSVRAGTLDFAYERQACYH